MATAHCPFCEPPDAEIALANGLAYGRWDNYPVNTGHLLLVPFRHVPEYFGATAAEKAALWRLVDEACPIIRRKHEPDGFNVGVNIGTAAGQSVFHVHIHVIPRYWGDVPNPKGGVRGVIPKRQAYVRKR